MTDYQAKFNLCVLEANVLVAIDHVGCTPISGLPSFSANVTGKNDRSTARHRRFNSRHVRNLLQLLSPAVFSAESRSGAGLFIYFRRTGGDKLCRSCAWFRAGGASP